MLAAPFQLANISLGQHVTPHALTGSRRAAECPALLAADGCSGAGGQLLSAARSCHCCLLGSHEAVVIKQRRCKQRGWATTSHTHGSVTAAICMTLSLLLIE